MEFNQSHRVKKKKESKETTTKKSRKLICNKKARPRDEPISRKGGGWKAKRLLVNGSRHGRRGGKKKFRLRMTGRREGKFFQKKGGPCLKK